jgi:hypothetical protein
MNFTSPTKVSVSVFSTCWILQYDRTYVKAPASGNHSSHFTSPQTSVTSHPEPCIFNGRGMHHVQEKWVRHAQFFFTLYASIHNATYLFSFSFSLSQHVSAVHGQHQVFLCQKYFSMRYVPLLSHMNAICRNLKYWALLKSIKINKVKLKFLQYFALLIFYWF